MPAPWTQALVSVLAVSALSLLGAFVLLGRGQVKQVLPILVAVAAGALLGDTFLHLLPHAVEAEGGFTAPVAWGVLIGVFGFFIIEGVIHWHHHGEDVHEHGPDGVHSFGWMNLIGDMVHNFIDGMLIAGAWLVSPEAGLATTVAVCLHEIPQEFGDFAVLLHAGFSTKRALLMNALSAVAAVVGAVIVLAASGTLGIETWLVPIAAGGFLYVACADLVPEIRKRARGAQLAATIFALALGLGLMAWIHEAGLEDGHHGHSHGSIDGEVRHERFA